MFILSARPRLPNRAVTTNALPTLSAASSNYLKPHAVKFPLVNAVPVVSWLSQFLHPSLVHRSADGLYSSSFDACVEGIQNFPVTKRRGSVGKCSSSYLISSLLLTLTVLEGTHFIVPTVAKRAVNSPSPVTSPPPPPSPQSPMWSSPPSTSSSVTASMNRSSLHGGPARGPQNSSQDARSSQNARSNFAVQPTANAGTFKLKKNVVKIVSAAGPVPTATRPPAPSPTPAAMTAGAAAPLSTAKLSSATGLAASRFAPKE